MTSQFQFRIFILLWILKWLDYLWNTDLILWQSLILFIKTVQYFILLFGGINSLFDPNWRLWILLLVSVILFSCCSSLQQNSPDVMFKPTQICKVWVWTVVENCLNISMFSLTAGWSQTCVKDFALSCHEWIQTR